MNGQRSCPKSTVSMIFGHAWFRLSPADRLSHRLYSNSTIDDLLDELQCHIGDHSQNFVMPTFFYKQRRRAACHFIKKEKLPSTQRGMRPPRTLKHTYTTPLENDHDQLASSYRAGALLERSSCMPEAPVPHHMCVSPAAAHTHSQLTQPHTHRELGEEEGEFTGGFELNCIAPLGGTNTRERGE